MKPKSGQFDSTTEHKKTMEALGRAAGWTRYSGPYEGGHEGRDFAIRANSKEQTMGGNHPHDVFIPGASRAAKYSDSEAVNRAQGSVDRK